MLKEYSFSTQQAGQMCTQYAVARINPSDTSSPGRETVETIDLWVADLGDERNRRRDRPKAQ